jgi:hypothetical protein
MKKIKNFPIRFGMMLVFVCGLSLTVNAANFTVDSTANTPDINTTDNICADENGRCTLRAAILQANATVGADSIDFDSTVFAPAQTILLEGVALPQITENVTITGTSASSVIIDGGESRIFIIGPAATVSISNLTVTNGYVGEGNGAGIFNEGNLTLNNVVVQNNTVNLGEGGGIYNATGILNVLNSSIFDNTARGDFGTGAGISNSVGTVTITNTVVRNNTATGIEIGDGGGILSSGGTVTITDSTVRDNESSGNGGGIAIFGGTLNVNRSTVGSSTDGGSNRASNGGGIFNQNGTVNLTNSTISGNFAGNIGGGYYGFSDGGLTALNSDSSTIAFNVAVNGGGITVSSIIGLNSVATINNTIISDNNAVRGPDVSDNNTLNIPGAINSTGYNIIENTSGANVTPTIGDQFNVDPLLLPLANNGGSMQTHALSNSPGGVSPAIDKGNSSEATDQRGFMRPVDNPSIPPATLGDNSDIGAFEVQIVTAAPVFIKGRVINENGRGVSKASVILTETDGTQRFTITNYFGYFRFENISVGQTVTVAAGSKKTRFTTLAVIVNDNIQDLNLTIKP